MILLRLPFPSVLRPLRACGEAAGRALRSPALAGRSRAAPSFRASAISPLAFVLRACGEAAGRALRSSALLSGVGFVLCLSPSLAQQKPKENAEVLVSVKIAGVDVPTNALLFFRLWEAGQADTINTNWSGAGTGATTWRDAGPFLMRPNRHYQAMLSAGSWQHAEVKFSAPPGHTLWINDRPAATFRATNPNGTLLFKLELRPDHSGLLPAGEALAPRVGDLVWSISAGQYSNGLSAGAIEWRASALSAALLDPTSLRYLEPDSAETAATWHSDGALLELRTFQMVLHVRRNATPGTGYDIEIHDPYVTRTGSGDGPYTYSAAPYRTYRVSNPNGATWNNQIKIERIESATETWTITQSGADWTVIETSALRTITRASTGSAPRVETVEVKDNANAVATRLQRKYQNFAWGQEELTEETANPTAVNGPALTTTYAYHTAAGGGYGRLQSVTYPDGFWVRYDYDSSHAGHGNLSAILRPWQDSPGVTAANATTSNCHATLLTHAGERDVFLDLPAGAETKINNVTVAKNTVAYAFPGNAPNGQPLRTETHTTYTSATSTLVATRQLYNPTAASSDYLGRLRSEQAPDGTKSFHLRYQGQLQDFGDSGLWVRKSTPPNNVVWAEYRFTGFAASVQDSVAVTTFDGEALDLHMVPNRSTVEIHVFDDQGRVRWTTRCVFTGATAGVPAFEPFDRQENYHAHGQPAGHQRLNGDRAITWWANGRLSGHSANDGVYTGHGYDAIGRLVLQSKDALAASGEYPAHGALYTHRSFDAAGRVVSETLSPSLTNPTGPDALATTRVFNPAGQLVSETNPAGLTTTFAYTNGGRTVTTTHPGGATTVTDRWLDGSPKSVTGSAVIPTHRQVTVNSDGTLVTATYVLRASDLAAPTAAPRWSKTTTDWAGRAIKEERPAPPGATPSTFTVTFTYNSLGQLTKRGETGLADILTAYNAWQQPHRTGLDLGDSISTTPNGLLDDNSKDRLTQTDTLFEKDANAAWWLKATTKAWNVDGNATPVTTSIRKTRLNKYDDHGRFFGSYVQSETRATDLFGNTTTRTVAVQRGSSYFETNLRLVTETIDHPDSTTDEVAVARHGLPQKTTTRHGHLYRTYYDPLARVVKTTDPRTDTSTTPRLGYYDSAAAAGARHQVAWREDTAGNRTEYEYYSTDGRLKAETKPAPTSGASRPVSYFAYSLRGEIRRQWGRADYPVEHEYNDYGEHVSQRTWRDAPGGVDFLAFAWGGSTYPSTTGDRTQWTFDPATGVLLTKTDPAGKFVSYTYDARQLLKTRAWARGVTTNYAYSATTAEQTGITYSDGTAPLTYTYNRMGLPSAIADGTGSRTFEYCDCGKPLYEILDSAFYGGRKITWKFDATTSGALGRAYGLTLATSGGAPELDLTYGFDASSRLNALTSTPTGFGAATFNYSYLANSHLLSSIAHTPSGWTQTRTWLPDRDLLDVIETKVSTATKARFDYAHDALGRRTSVAQTGEVFARYSGGGLVRKWLYNDRSELTEEKAYFGADPAAVTTLVPGRTHNFSYDQLGNRVSAASDNRATAYTTNALNQYTQRDVPGYADVSGLAPASATVTVSQVGVGGSGQTAGRQGDYFHHTRALSTATWTSFLAESSLGGSVERHVFLPQTPEAFEHDLDGNLTRDGRWDYAWDAENRLVSATTRGALFPSPIPAADARRVEFKYDYLGRRVQKTVLKRNAGNNAWETHTDEKFVYDGWSLLAEYNASGLALVRLHTWGPDFSGTRGGAGGVGGLLQTAVYTGGNARFQPALDGGGSVYGQTDLATGLLDAAYEYAPFGEIIRSTGPRAGALPFRYSTKYWDAELGLLHHDRRPYSPSLARFLGRDPIEEKGGLNLYAYVLNNPANKWDYLGMKIPDIRRFISGGIILGDGIQAFFANLRLPFLVKVKTERELSPEERIQKDCEKLRSNFLESSERNKKAQGEYRVAKAVLTTVEDGLADEENNEPSDAPGAASLAKDTSEKYQEIITARGSSPLSETDTYKKIVEASAPQWEPDALEEFYKTDAFQKHTDAERAKAVDRYKKIRRESAGDLAIEVVEFGVSRSPRSLITMVEQTRKTTEEVLDARHIVAAPYQSQVNTLEFRIRHTFEQMAHAKRLAAARDCKTFGVEF